MKTSGTYQNLYIKRDDKMVALKNDVTDFCEKFIKPVHSKNWDWSKRDFDLPKNDPTVEEARAIGRLIHKDLSANVDTIVDLSTINNVEAMKAYFNPKGKHEQFNMEEFAFALKVELEHGKIKDANVTNNHPFLTAMIALAHMSESLTYYKRLAVMELESESYEIMRKLIQTKNADKKLELYKQLAQCQTDLAEAQKGLAERLEKMDDIPVMEEI